MISETFAASLRWDESGGRQSVRNVSAKKCYLLSPIVAHVRIKIFCIMLAARAQLGEVVLRNVFMIQEVPTDILVQHWRDDGCSRSSGGVQSYCESHRFMNELFS